MILIVIQKKIEPSETLLEISFSIKKSYIQMIINFKFISQEYKWVAQYLRLPFNRPRQWSLNNPKQN